MSSPHRLTRRQFVSTAAAVAGAPASVVRYGWTGFVGQAGVTLGFAVLVEQRFPELGPLVKTVVLAAIALNQVVGPVLFRVGLGLAGETAAQTAEEAPA